jgi:hypothetical protein
MRVWEYEWKQATYAIKERARRRQAQCAVKECWKPATGISQYCKLHYDRNRKAGHPEARRITTGALRFLRRRLVKSADLRACLGLLCNRRRIDELLNCRPAESHSKPERYAHAKADPGSLARPSAKGNLMLRTIQ